MKSLKLKLIAKLVFFDETTKWLESISFRPKWKLGNLLIIESMTRKKTFNQKQLQVLAEEGVQKFISCVTWSKTTKCTKISSINAGRSLTFWHKNRWLSWSKEALNSIISKVKCIDHGKRKKTYFFLPMQFFDLFCGSHYSKSLIFVQKFNFHKNFTF